MELPVKAPVSGRRRTTYKLETKNLSYKLSSWLDSKDLNWPCCGQISTNTPSKQILIDVNCEARPGEVTAIAGPSGAGKTTLLEILAGKISRREFAGEVLVNQRPMEGKSFRRLSGYVTQEDALFPLLSVEETLMYSALLRLPGGRKEAGDRVKELITELGLDHVKKLRVGDGSNGGVSGGERRRVSIGVDLVHDPPVVLIDEPTSGLDSGSALHVVNLLKSMALSQHKTIVFTIHQPGFRILELIDRVVLLSTGLVIHNGSLNHLQDRLRFACHRVPRHVNVLEYAIDVIETLVVQSSRTIHFLDLNRENVVQDKNIVTTSYQNSIHDEVKILGKRFCSNIFRTKQLFATRVIQSLVASFLLGTIFYNVGHDQGPVALQTLIGFFAFTLTFLLSSTTEGLPIFLEERRILMTETSRGAYRVSSYVLANTLVFLPFLLLVGLLYATPVYFLVGLRQDLDGFMYFFMVVSLVLLMSNSFVSCFSALVPNFIMGTSMIAGLMGSFFLFSGYFIEKDHIPSYWIFMHYLSLFKYPFQCFMVNEFGGERGRRRCLDAEKIGGGCKLYGDGFLRQQGVEEWQKWGNVGVMLGFIVGYRVLCFLILWFRCYKTRS